LNAQYLFWTGEVIWDKRVRSIEVYLEEMEELYEAKLEMERDMMKNAILEAIDEIEFK